MIPVYGVGTRKCVPYTRYANRSCSPTRVSFRQSPHRCFEGLCSPNSQDYIIPPYSSLHENFTCTFRNNLRNQRVVVITALRRSRTQWVKRRRCSFRPSIVACTSKRVPTG